MGGVKHQTKDVCRTRGQDGACRAGNIRLLSTGTPIETRRTREMEHFVRAVLKREMGQGCRSGKTDPEEEQDSPGLYWSQPAQSTLAQTR